MKKLLTMIGAAAAAFGLYAALPAGTSFEDGAPTPGETGLWGGAEGAQKIAITAYQGSTITAPDSTLLPDQWSAGAGDKFLDIKTDGFDKPLWGYIDAERTAYPMKDGKDSLFFDGNVQFTAFDDEESVVLPDNETKLMVWVKENTDEKGDADGTYELMVTAGKWDSEQSKWVAQNYDCGAITDLETMKRVTIKSVGNIYATGTAAYGFEVYIDRVVRSCSADKALDTSRLTPVAKASNQYGYLFPSIVQGDSVTSVGFAGQGQLDCLSFTYAAPSFAQDQYFTINWDENVASVGYKLASEDNYTQCDMTKNYVSFLWFDMTTYDLQVEYKQNYKAGVWTSGDSVEFGPGYATVTVSAPDRQMTIVSTDATPRIVLLDEDGQPTTTTYPNFGEALAAVNTAASFKLQQNVTIKAADNGYTEASIDDGKDITIDLNGMTITGSEDLSDYVFYVQGANLTIVDTSAGTPGKIVAVEGNDGAIYVGCSGETPDAFLTIKKGTFEGLVDVDQAEGEDYAAADADIIAGSFDKASNGVEEFALAGYVNSAVSTRDDTDDYFVVKAIPQYEISVTKPEGATVTIEGSDSNTYEAGDTVPAGVKLFITAELDKVTYDPVIKVNGADYDDAGYTVTDAGVAIVVTEAAHVFTAKYYDAETSEEIVGLTPATFTVENAAEQKLPTPEKAGYTFVSWLADPTDDDSDVGDEVYASFLDGIEEVAPLELYAKFAALPDVAEIGDVKYKSLKEAIEAARAGDTLTVLADCTNTETAVFYNTGTNADNQITFVNNHEVTLDTKGNYSIYIVNANVKITGKGTFVKPSGAASAIVVGSGKQSGQSGRPPQLGWGVLDFEGNLTGGKEGCGSDAPSGMIKVEAGYCNFVGGSVTDYRSDEANGKCVSATSTTYTQEQIGDGSLTNALEYIGHVTIQSGTFYANTPLLAEDKGVLQIVGLNNTAKVKPLNDAKVLDYASFCEPGYTFLKVTNEQDPDYGWYKIGMNTFDITVTDGAETPALGTANPATFNVETTFKLEVTLTKPKAPQGKKFKSWSANYGTIVENTLTIDTFPNADVVVTVEWEDDAQPVIPGEDVDIPSGETAQSYADEINADPTLKAKLLKAPCELGETDLATYQALFRAAPNAAGTGVTFELAPTAAEELAADATADAAEALTGDAISVKAVKGLYYGLKEAGALDSMKVTDAKLATGEAIEFKPNKTGDAAFWQVIVSPTVIEKAE